MYLLAVDSAYFPGVLGVPFPSVMQMLRIGLFITMLTYPWFKSPLPNEAQEGEQFALDRMGKKGQYELWLYTSGR